MSDVRFRVHGLGYVLLLLEVMDTRASGYCLVAAPVD